MDNILITIKTMLGITKDNTYFDDTIIPLINNAFFVLHQLGVGTEKPFMLSDGSEEWNEFIDEGEIEAVKNYIFQKVKVVFDPPSNSSHLSAMENNIKEMEWRMNVAVDPKD